MVKTIKQILNLFNITSYDKIKKFGRWIEKAKEKEPLEEETDIKLLPNHYL